MGILGIGGFSDLARNSYTAKSLGVCVRIKIGSILALGVVYGPFS